MAGFQLTLYGRIWVTPEVIPGRKSRWWTKSWFDSHRRTQRWENEGQPFHNPVR